MHGQMGALGPGVSDVKQRIARELALDVEVPLLRVGCRIIRQGRFVAIPLHIDQSLIPPEGWNDTKRFRIGQRIQRCNSIRLRSLPRCREGVDEQVMRSIIPPHVYRQIKDSIPSPDHRIFVELVRNSKTWFCMVPVGKCRPARVAVRGYQVIATLQIGERSRSEEHTSELQSHSDLVCRLLLEKKKKKIKCKWSAVR